MIIHKAPSEVLFAMLFVSKACSHEAKKELTRRGAYTSTGRIRFSVFLHSGYDNFVTFNSMLHRVQGRLARFRHRTNNMLDRSRKDLFLAALNSGLPEVVMRIYKEGYYFQHWSALAHACNSLPVLEAFVKIAEEYPEPDILAAAGDRFEVYSSAARSNDPGVFALLRQVRELNVMSAGVFMDYAKQCVTYKSLECLQWVCTAHPARASTVCTTAVIAAINQGKIDVVEWALNLKEPAAMSEVMRTKMSELLHDSDRLWDHIILIGNQGVDFCAKLLVLEPNLPKMGASRAYGLVRRGKTALLKWAFDCRLVADEFNYLYMHTREIPAHPEMALLLLNPPDGRPPLIGWSHVTCISGMVLSWLGNFEERERPLGPFYDQPPTEQDLRDIIVELSPGVAAAMFVQIARHIRHFKDSEWVKLRIEGAFKVCYVDGGHTPARLCRFVRATMESHYMNAAAHIMRLLVRAYESEGQGPGSKGPWPEMPRRCCCNHAPVRVDEKHPFRKEYMKLKVCGDL